MASADRGRRNPGRGLGQDQIRFGAGADRRGVLLIGRRLTSQERIDLRDVPLVDRARARIVPVRWLPMGTAAMTLGRVVLMRHDHAHDQSLLAHEIVHVRQWRELGAIRFLWRYLRPYFAGRMRGLGHWDAYAQIPLEIEARKESSY